MGIDCEEVSLLVSMRIHAAQMPIVVLFEMMHENKRYIIKTAVKVDRFFLLLPLQKNQRNVRIK